ncbi:MAG TPA: amino acid adenylation domain-containing protein, partial [Herpetosiphonaceae bacterium]
RGYLHQPALTAERFVPDPFSRPEGTPPGARLYRTGDLGRWRPDGQLDFLGRIDQQVKLRGFRIELGEIESALRAAPAVRDAVVLLRHDTPGDPRLVAYVVGEQTNKETNEQPETTTPPSPVATEAEARRGSGQGGRGDEGLRAFLKDRLPTYMLPSAYVLLDALPLTAHGKVDRKALPAPDGDGIPRDGRYVAPRTPIEEVLTSIWVSVLRLEQIGAHENFFELGGHSLLVTQVIARVRATFQVELPLRSVFEAPTIVQLAERIELAQRAVQGISAPPVQPISRDGKLPLSYAQQRLWFLNQLQPESPAYNIATALYLIGPLDVATLQHSLSTIVQRHEALRTTFTTTNDGQPIQEISAAQELPLPVIDIEHLPADERETAALRLSGEEAQRPFDLAHGPLFRASLVHLDASRHVLLLTMHHIVADGWSMGVFMRELITLYAAHADNTIPALPELPIQYADYAVWQRDWLQGAVLDVQLAYWRQQLADLSVLQLPTDYPRPVISSFQGAAHVFQLPRPLADALVTLSRREQATLFMTLLAAWQILLARYSGQNDIVVGTTIAGRTRSEIEDLIGCFINTLVLRTDLSGSSTFRDVLQRVRQVCLGAYAHQDLPFEQVVEDLHPSRDLSRQPLFQVLFELQNAPMADIELPDLKVRPLVVEQATAKFDLSLTLAETEEGLVGVLAYATDLFAATTIERIAGHFQTLLEGIAANPEQPLTTLPILTVPEWQELIVTRNATRSAYPTDICFHQMFEAQVTRTPDAVAAVFGAEQLTYRELNARANQLAHYLRRLGVGPEVRVGICVERSFDMLIGLLGIFKAGGAFVPIEPAFPAERIAFILSDAQVSVVLTQDRLRERLPAYDATLVALDAGWPAIARESVDAPCSGVSADNLSYLIYTSGSTGRPKGVLIPHRGLVNYLYWCAEAYTVAHGRGAPVHASIAADAIFPSLFAPLIVGTSVVLISELQALEGLAEELCARGRFSMIKITPSQLEVLTQQLPETDMTTAVRTLVIGAEALRGEVLAYWQRYAPQTVLLNEYGPTETVVGCSIYRVEQAIRGAVPIGLPIANTTFYVLDRQLRPVPVGVPGELYIGGDGVAWGYHNRPELTAERFVPDPFSDTPGARLYKTGDLVISLEDRAGNIEFLGRRDDQVKIRGYRVEPGEIEVVLAQHAGVREVVVLAREDVPGDRRLVAYVVPQAREEITASELRSYLHAQLPEYMVPAAFVLLDAIPLAPHGKVDRKALPAPDTARPELGDAFVAPQTPAEMVVAQVWAEAIGIEQVGVHDNFFQLGGHSLQASRIIVQLRQIFQVHLPLRSLFEQPTVNGLIHELTRLWGGREGVDEIARIFKELEHLSDEEVKAMLSSPS